MGLPPAGVAGDQPAAERPVEFGDASDVNNPTNFTYGFKTRAGQLGLLQVTSFSTDAHGVDVLNIRYKLLAMGPGASKKQHEALDERLAAAVDAADCAEFPAELAAVPAWLAASVSW